MKTYAVYKDGRKIDNVRAENLRDAEKKAQRMYGPEARVKLS